jgi:hypothetical protein
MSLNDFVFMSGIQTILANVGTLICFRTGNPEDERFSYQLFNSFIKQGEISNLPAYNFYMGQSAKMVREPISGVTLLLNEENDVVPANSLIESSGKMYSKKVRRSMDTALPSKTETVQSISKVYNVPGSE